VIDAEEFLKANKGLIESLANKYDVSSAKFSREDLVQEANLAAVRAIEKFDDTRSKSKLTTYVYSAVNRSCRDYVRANINDLRVSNSQQAKNWREKKDVVENDNPSFGKFGTTESPTAIRLDAQISNGNNNESIGDTIPASGDASILDSCIKQEQINILLEEINSLSKKEQAIIRAHFLNGQKFSTIAKLQGLSRQRIHQIHQVAMNKLTEKVKERLEFELLV